MKALACIFLCVLCGVLFAGCDAGPRPVKVQQRFTADGKLIVFLNDYYSRPRGYGVGSYPPGTELVLLEDRGRTVLVFVDGEELELPASGIERNSWLGDQLKNSNKSDIAARAAPMQRGVREDQTFDEMIRERERIRAEKADRSAIGGFPLLPASTSDVGTEAAASGCSKVHHNGGFHRAIDGELYPCPQGVSR